LEEAMRILTKDELWRCYLKKESMPIIRESEEERIFFLEGLEIYFSMIRNHPRQALTCIGGAVLILLLMFGLILLAGAVTS
jgi:hypothetical protein